MGDARSRTEVAGSRWNTPWPRLALGCLLFLAALPNAPATLRLNEVVSRNQSGLRDESGARPDWIEVVNPGSEPVSLIGWSLSDDPRQPRRWTFRAGTLEAGARGIVFASGDDRQPQPASPRAPHTLPGLVSWLRARDIDPGDPAQVRVSGSVRYVRRWLEAQGAGGGGALQDQSHRQPRWVEDPVPAVDFDGIDDLLQLGGTAATNSFTVLVVMQPLGGHEEDAVAPAGVGGVSGQRWLWGAAHGGDTGAGAGISAGTNGVAVYEHGSGYMPAVAAFHAPLGSGPALVALTYDARRPMLSVNGQEAKGGAVSGRARVTSSLELGAGAYGAFRGRVREVLIYHRALDAAERRGVEEHLMADHGILPAVARHASFRLDGDGEQLLLTAPDGRLADDVRIPALPADVAWARTPDAGGPFRYAEPTPGGENPDRGATAWLGPVRLGVEPGFHPGPFQLGLENSDEGSVIRYTLDGTEPTASSPVYSGTLTLSNRASLPNVMAMIPTGPGWQPPAGAVFKGTVVRARAFREDALPGPTVTGTYFVHPSGRARYSLPVVCLTTESKNLFDPAVGIYVPGLAPGGNYAQSGDAWERPVHVEFFETNGVRALAQEAGLRIHGNTSFGFPIKALRLHARNQRGTEPFRHRIFPDLEIDRFERLLLRPSGHDQQMTMMRDGLMQGLVRELGLDMQGYRPAVLFLNGEYWGLHNLQEAFEKEYFASHHPGVDADAIDYLEGYPPGMYAYEGDSTAYLELMATLAREDVRDPVWYAWAGARMEMGSFRDYKLAEIFHYRWDIGNHRVWRPRTPDGRYRWILFDCDVGFGGFWSEPQPWSFNMLEAVLEPTGSLHGHNNDTTVFLLRTLLRNGTFRDDFVRRAADLLNTTLESGRIRRFIDGMAAEIAPEMQEHLRRWRVPATMSEWQRQVEALRTFGDARPRFMREHLRSRFGLGAEARLTLGVSPPAAGRVRCNSLSDVVPASGTWTGIYFRGQGLELGAEARAGWRFAGWRELPGWSSPGLEVRLAGDTTLTAEFVPVEPLRITAITSLDPARFAVTAQGEPGTTLVLEGSEGLRAWSPVGVRRVVPADGLLRWELEGDARQRFWRVVRDAP